MKYLRIPERPRVVGGDNEFAAQAKRIADWCAEKHQGLRIGAVWGERGSGKTSMLRTIGAHLAESGDEELVFRGTESGAIEPFEPGVLAIEEDNIFIAFVEWLKRGVLRGWSADADDAYRKLLRFEAGVVNPTRFLDFETEVATDREQLEARTADFHARVATPTRERREHLRTMFNRRRRYVLVVDDVDLAPIVGPKLVELLVRLFRANECSVTVLLAADRPTFLEALDTYMQASGNTHLGLASKVLAKSVGTDWYLPTPTLDQKCDVVEFGGGDTETVDGREPLIAGCLWAHFRSPLFRRAVFEVGESNDGEDEEQTNVFARDRRNEDVEPLGVEDAVSLANEALPQTWRGVNRVYNRLATLFEEVALAQGRLDWTRLGDGFSKYESSVGGRPENVPAFFRVLFALDESFPELELLRSFLDDADGLRRALEMTSRNATFTDPNQEEVFHERLGRIEPHRKARAEPLLRRFAWLWQELWQGPDTSSWSFVPFSVRGNAAALAELWADEFFRGEVHHLDLLELAGATADGDPISLAGTRDVSASLAACADRPTTHARDRSLLVFPLAPLSLCAQLGHLLRRHPVAGVFGATAPEFFVLRLEEKSRNRSAKPLMLGKEGVIEAERALVVVSVGGAAGVSDATPFYSTSKTLLNFGGPSLYMFETEDVFEVRSEADVANLVFQIVAELTTLRNAGAREIHLGLKMPAALAFLLGTKLNSVHPIHLYEYSRVGTEDRYDEVCVLGGEHS